VNAKETSPRDQANCRVSADIKMPNVKTISEPKLTKAPHMAATTISQRLRAWASAA
jgi:hypothetical protein